MNNLLFSLSPPSLQPNPTDGDGLDSRSEQQRAEYAARGINLVAYDQVDNKDPYFSNLDADAFRSNRFM